MRVVGSYIVYIRLVLQVGVKLMRVVGSYTLYIRLVLQFGVKLMTVVVATLSILNLFFKFLSNHSDTTHPTHRHAWEWVTQMSPVFTIRMPLILDLTQYS